MGITHIPFNFCSWYECCHRVNHNDVYATAPYENFCNFKSLFTGIRLRNKEFICFNADFVCIAYIKGMFSVYKCGSSANVLDFSNDLKRQRCFTRCFRTENLNNPSSWQAAYAKGNIQRYRTCGYNRYNLYGFFSELHDGAFSEKFFYMRYSHIYCFCPVFLFFHLIIPPLVTDRLLSLL